MFKYVGLKDLKDIENKKLSDLTVTQLKEVIREVISEEIAKRTFVQPLIPMQPYYYQPLEYPYKHQEVWADTKTTPKNIK